MITKESYHRSNAVNHKPDNVDINRHPIHVGYVIKISFTLILKSQSLPLTIVDLLSSFLNESNVLCKKSNWI